jgi:hypothetical protein
MLWLRQVAKGNHPLVQTILHTLFVARYDISTSALPNPIMNVYSKFSSFTILDIIHRPVFYLKLNVPHRNHITSPLRAQQVNALYRFVTLAY